MEGKCCYISLSLTQEEAEELLGRCLSSKESDTPAFQQALLKLARATFLPGQSQSSEGSSQKAA